MILSFLMDIMKLIDDVKKEVYILLNNEKSGHGMDHIERVLDLSIKLSIGLDINITTLSLIALLHDVDDYKIVGINEAKELVNAKRILNKYVNDLDIINNVLDSISKIGYSKRLEGIKPNSLEGMIVSDADMLDAMGAFGITRSISYALSKNRKIFDSSIYPNLNLSSDEYKNKDNTTMVNHIFEKLLKLKDLMLTKNAKEEALIRHQFMVDFLREYFRELNQRDWLLYLEDYLK